MTIKELENTYIEDINMLGDWFMQYEYLLELSVEMPKIPEEERSEKNKVKGCQSGVWLSLENNDGIISVGADSDALIIRGILSIVVSLLNNRKAEEIVSYEPRFISETNIKNQISTDRFNGINSVIRTVQDFAEEQLNS